MRAHRFSRRHFLRAAAGAAGACACLSSAPAAAKPNILFIAVDDLNDWVGCLGGHPDAKTPNLDRLASRGVLFNHAYCAAPACNPSRAALMTGIRPSTSGVYYNGQPWRESAVLKDAVTLPQRFMAHGYHALGAGKIYHGRFPDPPSWKEYWPSQENNTPDNPNPPGGVGSLAGLGKAHFDWGPIDAPKEEMGDWQTASWVSEQLGRDFGGQPFFLACGFYRPHLPWYAPRAYFDKFPLDEIALPAINENDLDDVPRAGRRMARPGGDHADVTRHGQHRKAVQAYLACINFMDECLGRVIDALDHSPHRENTIVVLWSDHGWHLGEKLHWRKFTLWEEAARNVLLIAAPGVTRPEGRCEAPVSLLNLYPTLCELAGVPAPEAVEGTSLVPLLEEPGREWRRPALTTHGRNNHSVRSRRWRYIRYAGGSEEFYDHRNDPHEWTNLAGDPEYASIIREHARWLPDTNAALDPD